MLPIVEPIAQDDRHAFRYRWSGATNFSFNWHIHPELELTWIASGYGHRYVGDHVEAFHEGDLVLLGSALPHTWHSPVEEEKCASVVIQFLPEFLGQPFYALPEMMRVKRLLKRADKGIVFTGPASCEAGVQMVAMNAMSPIERLSAFLLILDRLAGSHRTRTLASPTYAGVVRDQDRQRMDRLHAFLHQHYDQAISLADAAKIAKMNVTAFARYFRQMTGQSFVAYLQQMRVGHVCRQLIESDTAITDICFANGFGTLSNFNRIFARLKGCTPREYRQQYTGEH